MRIIKDGDNDVKAFWNYRESRIICASINQTMAWIEPSEIQRKIGASADYLQAIFDHDVAVSRNRPEKPSNVSLTLHIVKVKDDEFSATMTPTDIQVIANCVKAALRTTPLRELRTIYEIKGEEFQTLLDQIQKAQRQLFPGSTT